jgi:poly(hydroxyalkanoate) depolymerase family esterase
MVKTINPWLRGLLRAGKKQQRSVARVIGTLLAPPKPAARAKPKPRPKAPAAAVPATVAPLKTKRAKTAAPAPQPATPATPATGKWLASYLPGVSERGALRRMSYWLYLPDHPPADSAAGLPLIVMLHGCDQTATLFAQGTRMNQLAETAGYAVLYPQQSVSSHRHRCWKWFDRATQQGGGDVPMIIGIINKVRATYPIDGSRIYICGISAGAAMANIVALNHPDLFAGLGLHSGPSFGGAHSTIGALTVMQHGAGTRVDGPIAEVLGRRDQFHPLPTILIHGDDDPVVRPINLAHLTRQAMLVNNLAADSPAQVAEKVKGGRAYQLRDVYSGSKVMLRVARVAELKHAWSGGDERVSFNSAQGPDASKMMLDFFSRHRRA